MKNFFTTSIKSIKQTGIISPSSSYLVRNMMKNIEFKEGQVIVEFGTGDGCLTEAILEGMAEGSRLVTFELNDDFYRFARRKFDAERRVELHKDTALNFDNPDYLEEECQIDYVVSSLPLTLLRHRDVKALFAKVKTRLKPGGKYIQYQYSLGKRNDMKRVFDSVSTDYTLLNIPPAFVYTCSR